MEKYTNYDNFYGPWLNYEDFNKVIDYLKDKISENNITIERIINGYDGNGSYRFRDAKRLEVEKAKKLYIKPYYVNGSVYSYDIGFLFYGRNEEGLLSIYDIRCSAEGYRDLYPEMERTSLGRVFDVQINNLLPTCYCFIKDILSEEIKSDDIEIIDQPDSGYEWDFHYLKLERENKPLSRWKCTKAYNIDEFVESNGSLLIRPMDSYPEDQLEKTPYIPTRAGYSKKSIKNIRYLVEEGRKKDSVFPKYFEYSTIYKDDKILVFNMDGTCYLVTDPDVIKKGVEEHIFAQNNYILNDDIVNIKPFTYKSEINNYKDVLCFKGTSVYLNIYGDSDNLIDEGQLYSGALRNGKSILLHAGPLITDKKTKKPKRLVYTFNKD